MLEKSPLWYFIIPYIAFGYLNNFIAYNFVSPSVYHPKLFDYGHYILPEISTLFPDFLFFSIFLYFLVRWRKNQDLLKSFFLLAGILFILRLFTFPMTMVPPAASDCYPSSEDAPWIFFVLYTQSTCIDYMFSAHTFHLTLFTLFTIVKSSYTIEKVCITTFSLITFFMIIAARLHYTADVIIAFILCTCVFSIYFLIEKNLSLKRKLIES
ncbi:MAG: phosphatase PAP2-related protein [Candidatus Marinimicrobia bacterium]|jgi:hypothetical protein|nr:phosphatase PAP2-related protein [Candidatus Neomarinimicrobiota bacterium]